MKARRVLLVTKALNGSCRHLSQQERQRKYPPQPIRVLGQEAVGVVVVVVIHTEWWNHLDPTMNAVSDLYRR